MFGQILVLNIMLWVLKNAALGLGMLVALFYVLLVDVDLVVTEILNIVKLTWLV